MLKSFESVNRLFWKKYQEKASSSYLLVETSEHPVINHANAVVGKIVARALGVRIAWLVDNEEIYRRMKSYSADSIYILFPKVPRFILWSLHLTAWLHYLIYIRWLHKIKDLKYKKIQFGDMIYDCYLSLAKKATMHYNDFSLVKVLYLLFVNEYKARYILKSNPIKAILVSHHIGLVYGPFSRVSLQLNKPVYWKGGGHKIVNISVFRNLSEIHDYPKHPSTRIINRLVKNSMEQIQKDFQKITQNIDNPYYGFYSEKKDINKFSIYSRKQFLHKFDLSDRTNVFVMLHAFNDYPHSHFKQMLFNDYYDWFDQTLKFALTDTSKNWIFKEHPANIFYQTKDLNLIEKMNDLPAHIRFISAKDKITASTVINSADLIVTCLGSAGVEIPAFKGTPVLLAGDSSYSGLGFTLEPKTIEEYFDILKAKFFKTLTPRQLDRAKATYVYLLKYCMVPFSAGPEITFYDSRHPELLKQRYFEKIMTCYRDKSSEIDNEIIAYSKALKNRALKVLTRLPNRDSVD